MRLNNMQKSVNIMEHYHCRSEEDIKEIEESSKRWKIEEIRNTIRQDLQDLKLLSNFSTIGGTGDDLKFYRKFLSDIILNNIKDLRKILENNKEE